jgi:hypothetical protein
MAKRRRSLLGKKARAATGIPAPSREGGGPVGATGPSSAPAPSEPDTPDDASAASDEASTEAPAEDASASTEAPAEDASASSSGEAASSAGDPEIGPPALLDDPLLEDDAPLIGGDLTIPPPEDDADVAAAPREMTAHLHTAPPVPEAGAGPDADAPAEAAAEDLVVFEDRPEDEPDATEPEVAVDDDPFGLDHLEGDAHPLVGQDSGMGAAREEPPPIVDDDHEADTDVAGLPPGFARDDAPPMRQGTPQAAPARRPGTPVPGFEAESDGFLHHEGGDPPTEEASGPAPEDLADLYRAPMNVPEPPPIPGILDRYTPAPTGRTQEGQGTDERPAYVPVAHEAAGAPEVTSPKGLWDETPHPAARSSVDDTPTPPEPVRARPQSRQEAPFWRDPFVLGAAVLAAVLAVAALVGISMFVLPDRGRLAPTDGQPVRTRVPVVSPDGGLPPAQGLPGATQDGPGAMPPSDPTADPPPEEPVPPPTAGDAGRPGVTPPPTVAPAPVPRPTVRPTQAPASTPERTEPAGRTGTLRIRAQRAVLVNVNGVPVGYTPQELQRPPGEYTISAKVDGRSVEQKVDLRAGKIRVVEF